METIIIDRSLKDYEIDMITCTSATMRALPSENWAIMSAAFLRTSIDTNIGRLLQGWARISPQQVEEIQALVLEGAETEEEAEEDTSYAGSDMPSIGDKSHEPLGMAPNSEDEDQGPHNSSGPSNYGPSRTSQSSGQGIASGSRARRESRNYGQLSKEGYPGLVTPDMLRRADNAPSLRHASVRPNLRSSASDPYRESRSLRPQEPYSKNRNTVEDPAIPPTRGLAHRLAPRSRVDAQEIPLSVSPSSHHSNPFMPKKPRATTIPSDQATDSSLSYLGVDDDDDECYQNENRHSPSHDGSASAANSSTLWTQNVYMEACQEQLVGLREQNDRLSKRLSSDGHEAGSSRQQTELPYEFKKSTSTLGELDRNEINKQYRSERPSRSGH
jgi:hypothetical protein